MRRDMDLIRELLLKLESLPVEAGSIVSFDLSEVAVDGYTDEHVGDHLRKLYRAGFIDSGTSDNGDSSGYHFYFRDLTWAGMEFIDNVREHGVWHRTKEEAKKVGAGSFGLLLDLANGVVKAEAMKHGLPLG